MRHAERKAAIERLLLCHQDLWRPQPFKEPDPAWCTSHPALAAEALAMDDAELESRAADPMGLIRWLSRHRPELSGLGPLTDLPRRPARGLPATPSRLERDIPGRKQAQIRAFAEVLGAPAAPILEWCAGKGHLGRLLASAWQVPVTSLEIDPGLCSAGAALARRAQVAARQGFLAADALDSASAAHLDEHHAVALHACGDLHRTLVAVAAERDCPALDLVPCCYYRTVDSIYRPFAGGALRLDHDDLRLAVTDTVTASPRLRRRSRQAMAWKLAWQALARQRTGQPYHALKPVPEAWMQAGFTAWCRRLAEREGLALPDRTDWPGLEARGWQLAGRVRRLELVRLAFRRALELWLVLDMAVHLEAHGYRLELGTFCDSSLTPRNLLLSARRV